MLHYEHHEDYKVIRMGLAVCYSINITRTQKDNRHGFFFSLQELKHFIQRAVDIQPP